MDQTSHWLFVYCSLFIFIHRFSLLVYSTTLTEQPVSSESPSTVPCSVHLSSESIRSRSHSLTNASPLHASSTPRSPPGQYSILSTDQCWLLTLQTFIQLIEDPKMNLDVFFFSLRNEMALDGPIYAEQAPDCLPAATNRRWEISSSLRFDTLWSISNGFSFSASSMFLEFVPVANSVLDLLQVHFHALLLLLQMLFVLFPSFGPSENISFVLVASCDSIYKNLYSWRNGGRNSFGII